MKVTNMKKTLSVAVLALAVLAGSVSAQNIVANNYALVSATAVPRVQLAPQNRAWVFLRAANLESATLIYRNKEGTELQSTAVAVGTTYTSVTLPGPQFAHTVAISYTTLTGSDAASATVIQSKDAGIY